MSTRTRQRIGYSTLVVLFLALVVAVIASNVWLRGARLDLTQNGLYTLGKGTKAVLKDIREPIDLYFFFSNDSTKNLQQIRAYANRVREMLEEFAASTPDGKLVLHVVDPVPFSEDDDRLIGPTHKLRWSYACGKAVDECLAQAYYEQHQLPVVTVRCFNTCGPRQSSAYGMVIPNMVLRALRGEPILVYGDGQQSRCFSAVSDVVRGAMLLADILLLATSLVSRIPVPRLEWIAWTATMVAAVVTDAIAGLLWNQGITGPGGTGVPWWLWLLAGAYEVGVVVTAAGGVWYLVRHARAMGGSHREVPT